MTLLLLARLLTVTGVATLAGLAGTVAPAVVHADEPQIATFDGPAQVAVNGSGFAPGATLQLEVVNPLVPAGGGPLQVLNVPDSRFITAGPCGQIGEPPNFGCNNGSLARLPVPAYVGPAEVLVTQCGAACGDPTRPVLGPVVAQVQVLPAAQLQATAIGPARGSPTQPLQCSISVFGSGFGTLQQGVQVVVTDGPFGESNRLAPAQTVQPDASGNIGLDSSAFSFDSIAPGTTVTALPNVAGQAVSTPVNACGTSTTGQISVPGSGQIGSATGGAGRSAAPGGGTGGIAAGQGSGNPRVHAHE